MMMYPRCLLAFFSVLLPALALPATPSPDERGDTKVSQWHDSNPSFPQSAPYFVVFANDGVGSVNFASTAPDTASVNVEWRNSGSFEAGKGWERGSSRNITYSGVYQPRGHSWIGVSGWTRVSLAKSKSRIISD
jgi:hypothetical protein